MTSALAKQFEETLKNINQVSPEQIQELLQNTLSVFRNLQERVSSANKEERENAIGEALELKRALEIQESALAQASGMSTEQLSKFIENPANFSTDTWEMLGNTKNQLANFHQELRESMGISKIKTTHEGMKKKSPSRADWLS